MMTSRLPGLRVYGLTGGVASGKTSVGRFFSELGVPVVDADALARELRTPGGAAHDWILKEFGTAEAPELRGLIFEDPQKRRKLEAFLHPLIQKESERRMREVATQAHPGYALYEAALLVETGRHRELDGLIVVESDPELQVRRLVARDHVDERQARQILAAQGDPSLKRAAATHLIINDGTLQDLQAQVVRIHALLRA